MTYLLEGTIVACGNKIEKGNMLVSKMEDTCSISLEPHTHILLFGGIPFPEERFIYWNFVSSNKEKIEKAREDWKNKKFPKVAKDTSYIPLPEHQILNIC